MTPGEWIDLADAWSWKEKRDREWDAWITINLLAPYDEKGTLRISDILDPKPVLSKEEQTVLLDKRLEDMYGDDS